MEAEWAAAQVWERNWWMTAREQHSAEIVKGGLVARMMMVDRGMAERSVLDIGCGPFSLLQRIPVKKEASAALDPLHYGDLEESYTTAGIRRIIKCAEDLTTEDGLYDEAWIYNCLQHVKNPQRIIERAMQVCDTLRFFEWTGIPPYKGHLWELTPSMIETPLRANGWVPRHTTTGWLAHNGLDGTYYCAIWSKTKKEQIVV